jgi:phosphate transport system substrate-binding protein
MKKTITALSLAVLLAASAGAQAKPTLQGAGATFPQPLYLGMFDSYLKTAGIKVNYQGIGSGAGIQQLTAKTVDFGASDAPMSADEQTKAGADVLHIPTCVGAIVLTYNIPGITGSIKLTGNVIAGIYLGTIQAWNDAAIQSLNPEYKLPDLNIVVVRRSDSSGTSYNFSGYLTKVSPDWASQVGQSKSPKWPVGVGGKGNPGVASYVKQVPGSIGYVEIAFARQNKMPVAIVQNKSGAWVDPNDLKSVAAAADIAFPADAKADIINTDAKSGYPIAATTWLLLYKDQGYAKDQAKSKAVLDLMWWMIHDGQKLNEGLDYATLPPAAVKVAESLLKSVTFNGAPLLK